MITCSADKNVKIWGLDFGDCHKSIFAHDDSIMQVAFEKDSHCFWTVGKDRLVKYWDGDRVWLRNQCRMSRVDGKKQFELIQKLEGHHGEIWALAVSNRGTFVVTGSHDKSIRIWEKTDEPLFLEEERERDIEASYDSNIANDLNSGYEREKGDEIEAVQKQTSETLMAGEKIMEALEVADGDREAFREWEEAKEKYPNAPRPTRSTVLAARGDLSGDEHVLLTIQKIPAASMEDSLLVLPFRQVVSLLGYLDQWAQKVRLSSSKFIFSHRDQDRDIILTSRILTFLLRTHSSQLIANRTLRPTILTLRSHLRDALSRQRELMGYNIAALRFLKGRWEGERFAGMMMEEVWDEEKVREKIQSSKAKRKRVNIV